MQDTNPPAVNGCPELVRSTLEFPVVGIGASAGGLAAMLRMFEEMPAAVDMAFVVVLHLSPKHESNVDQILQRVTAMKVIQVTDATEIKKGYIYVIAPTKQLSMNDDYILVSELKSKRSSPVAIDIFFRTLAEVHRERAVAIVLSGSGSDGAVGLARIKEQGGVTIAHDPRDAEHDGMPVAAIATGTVDFVLPVIEIPQKLIELWTNARAIELPPISDGSTAETSVSPSIESQAEATLAQILALLCAHTGHDF